MSQNSLVLPTTGTLSGLSLVTDVNGAFDTLNTLNSGGAAPSPTEADMLWMDTTNNLLKQRDGSNANWYPQAVRGVPHGGGMRLSGFSATVTGSSTLTSAVLGQLVTFSPTAAITATLPLANTFPAGTGFMFSNTSNSTVTFGLQGGNTGDANLFAAAGDQGMLISDGNSYWRVVLRSNMLSETISNAGFVRHAGGTIFQIGNAVVTTNSAGGGGVTFAEPFPNAALMCLFGNGDNGTTNIVIQGIQSQLNTAGAGFQAFVGNTGTGLASTAIRVNYIAFGN